MGASQPPPSSEHTRGELSTCETGADDQVKDASGQYKVNLELQKVFQRFCNFTDDHRGSTRAQTHQHLPSRITGRSPSPEPLPPHQRPLTGASRPPTVRARASHHSSKLGVATLLTRMDWGVDMMNLRS